MLHFEKNFKQSKQIPNRSLHEMENSEKKQHFAGIQLEYFVKYFALLMIKKLIKHYLFLCKFYFKFPII